mgnify:CR=1 FL=1
MLRKILFLLLPFGCFSPQLLAQSNHFDSLTHQNVQRQYAVHLPPGYTGTVNLPLVITLHGGSGTYVNVQGFTQMNQVSNQNGFIVAYPQGYGVAPPGFAWADGRGTSADQAEVDDVGFMARLIDTLAAQYAIDTQRVYVCGFSNGGFMTQRLACERPDLFAAVGGLGCSMDTSLYASCAPGQAVPMMYVAGTADPFVPFEGGVMNGNVTPIVAVDSALQFWVRQNGCQSAAAPDTLPDRVPTDNSRAVRQDFTDCDCGAEVRYFRLLGAGHTWAGVEIAAQEPVLGETNEDIHASFELWDFFSPFARCEEANTAVSWAGSGSWQAQPNPFGDQLTLQGVLPSATPVKGVLYDATGRPVHRWSSPGALPAGPQTWILDTRELPAGLYHAVLITSGGRVGVKVLKR